MCLGRLYTIQHIWWNREFPENSLSKWLTGLSGLILKGGSIDISLCFILWISAQRKRPPHTHRHRHTQRKRFRKGWTPDLISFQYLESCRLVPSFINCQLRGIDLHDLQPCQHLTSYLVIKNYVFPWILLNIFLKRFDKITAIKI